MRGRGLGSREAAVVGAVNVSLHIVHCTGHMHCHLLLSGAC